MKRLGVLLFALVFLVVGVSYGALTVTQDHPIHVTGTTAAIAAVTTNRVTITAIYWFSPDTVGHLAAIQDGNGREIMEFECVVADQGLWWVPPEPIVCPNGIYMDDMDSGTLYIYIK